MAEAGDGAEQQAGLEVQAGGAVTQETDRDSMEAISEPGTSKDAGDPEAVDESSPTMPEREEEGDGAGNETETKEAEDEPKHEESPSEPVSPQEALKTVYVDEKEDPEETEDITAEVKDSSEETPEGPDVSEDSQMDMRSDLKQDDKQTNFETEEGESRAEEEESRAEEEESRAEEEESRAEEEESRAEEEIRVEEEESRVEEEEVESRMEEEESRVEEEEVESRMEEEEGESRTEEEEGQSRAEKEEEEGESRMEEEEGQSRAEKEEEGESRTEEEEGQSRAEKEEEDGESRTEEEGRSRAEKERSLFASKLSAADDLDEMMDIGTVDQMEQEAQMKEEENRSPTNTNTDGISAEEEEADVKPTASDLMQSSSSPSSEAAGSTGRDSSSPAAVVNGMKVVKLSIPRLESVRLTETEGMKSSSSPPLAKVKDEPVDEEYEQALISSTSTASVKDEPVKDDLKIGSVYSVTPSGETLPCVNPSTVHMSCSNCRKNLQKGQTAFQRKGSPALFCSTACLTTALPSAKGSNKLCHNCQKMILRPQDVILAPDPNGIMKEFCSQICMNAFSFKKQPLSIHPAAVPAKSPQTQSLCSMCSRFSTNKHEVILRGTVHKMCSDSCFNRFRTINNLTMAGCANCGSYCQSKPVMLKLEDSSKTLCNMDCLAKYKEKTKVILPCTMCRAPHVLPHMLSNKNSDESVNMFCSNSCLMAFKVQNVSSSGARLNCDHCGKNTVPSYHLAMSDTSIRNFCSMTCVMVFQDKFKKNQSQLNVFTKLPGGSSQAQIPTPTQLVDVPKLSCFQCSQVITSKPELIQIKDKIVFLCSSDCSMEYKKANAVMSLCEYCKIEKITREAKRINNKDCFFCSDGCKLLFRHELSKNWGKHCHSCVYCHCVSKKLVTAQYGGSVEEFCSEDCRSKYTMLFCHVAKCDSCGRKGKLKQSLPLLGEVKHFCGISCLLKFCCDKVATQGEVLKAAGEATPVIASVMSLADQPAGKSKSADKPAQQSSKSKSKTSGNMSVQTDTPKSHPPAAPPPAAPKLLKNKALLCKPLVQNKGVSCKTQTVSVEAQTDDMLPRVMVVPVPVPVYVPVPMNMYSQFAPKPLSLPLPLPVPMFLPVTMNSAERIVETIQEIKQKIPSDPYEAELILMAEMVAEGDDEQNGNKPETRKEKASERQSESKEVPAPDDHISNYSDDLDTDDLASFLNNWEETSSDAGLRLPSRQFSSDKLNPVLDVPVVAPEEPESDPLPPPGPPPMDIEADFSIETLERLARLREHCSNSPSPTPAPKRRQAQRKARDKRGRKSQRAKAAEESPPRTSAKKSVSAEILKLKSQYGVDAWKRWIQWRQTQPNLEQRRFGSRPLELKEDLLSCTTAELSYGLCCFITEVKRPSGEPYSPDSLFYLCLGIQQYLFENGRVENIFMDRFYGKFSSDFTNMLKGFEPTITRRGYVHSRVEEEFLWGCKQLGAYSPIVLLNTLLFFCCKYFGFTTVEQHRQLSFAHVMRCTKTNPDNTKTTFLRFYPPIPANEAESDPEGVPAKKRKEEETKEEILEMMENTDNPLRCPVRLYEFYLSKCSESVKQRTNMFYLHPERCCVPNSPLWFSSTPLDDNTMESMLIRILTVRELHLRTKKERQVVSDPPFIPEEEDEDSD